MRGNRNHEGYYDSTACIAIRRVDTLQKRKKAPRVLYLTYKIEELPCFWKAITEMRR